MAISYRKIRENKTIHGIDVFVEFYDDTKSGDIIQSKIFLFQNETDIKNNFGTRMTKALINVNDFISAKTKPSEIDIYRSVEKWFKTNSSLTRLKFNEFKVAEEQVEE